MATLNAALKSMSDEQREKIITSIKKLTDEIGRVPTANEFLDKSKISRKELQKEFSSYDELLKESYLLHLKGKMLNIPNIVAPLFPEDDLPVDEFIDLTVRRNKKRKEAHDAKTWMTFQVKTDLPIALNFFGDPHIDDDGCNWELLKKHTEICKKTEGMYGINIGDVHNNWVGRLASKYADQSTTRATAWKFIKWLFQDSGVKWLIMLAGNHDSWNYGLETLSKYAENVCPMIDWRAKFKLKFSNGKECLIDAAHDHTGHSQWNPLHGQQKASMIGGAAHIYAAGHKHTWGIASHECPHTNRVYHLLRARGYKEIDEYSDHHGFGNQKNGASVTAVINPRAENDASFIKCFPDPEVAVAYLTFLRSQIK